MAVLWDSITLVKFICGERSVFPKGPLGIMFWLLSLIISCQRAPTAWRVQKMADTSVWVTPGVCLYGVHLLWSVWQSGCRTGWKWHQFKWSAWLSRPICLAALMIWVSSMLLIHLWSLSCIKLVCLHCQVFICWQIQTDIYLYTSDALALSWSHELRKKPVNQEKEWLKPEMLHKVSIKRRGRFFA